MKHLALILLLAFAGVARGQTEEVMAKEALNKAVFDLESLDFTVKALTASNAATIKTTDDLLAQWKKDWEGTGKPNELPAFVAIALAITREAKAGADLAYAKTKQDEAAAVLVNAFKNAEAGLWKSVLENSATASTMCAAGKTLGTDPASVWILEAISANFTASGLMVTLP